MMDQKTRELWVIPIIISLVIGTLLGVIFLYLNAWATGVPIVHSPFTLGWIKLILLMRLPLWIVLLFVAGTALIVLYLRERAEKKSASTVISAGETESAPVGSLAAMQKFTTSQASAPPVGQAPKNVAVSEAPASSIEGDSLVINSPDQFSVRISRVESADIRGIQLQIENYRLTSIHQIRVILSSASSFDSRHEAFREPSLTGRTFSRPNMIRPSCSGVPILIVWKAPQGAGLVTGENNLTYRLPWPDKDSSDVERWKLSLRVLAFDWPPNAAGNSTPLRELDTDVVVLWSRARNEFSIENPVPSFPALFAAFPLNGEDGVSRKIVRFIMCGQDQLLAYATTRENLPGTRFLVVRARPNLEPQSLQTPDRDAANAKWNEWYREWKGTGFGGASGNGLNGAAPF